MDEKYINQVSLLINVLQFISKEKCFALKGGSAINLFYYNLPRLSVDIDLTYIGFEPRLEACKNINSALDRIAKDLNFHGYSAIIQGNDIEKKILRSNSLASIKIEPNYIIRGFINKPDVMSVCKMVEDKFGYAEIQVVSMSELFGGKICAALDRQHPRDLFDIKEYFKENSFNPELMQGFITMLLSHDKPIHEILNPNIKNQKEIFEKQFVGMTDKPFTYKEHVNTLNNLIKIVKTNLLPYKNLLLDFVSLKADLKDFKINNLDKLPAIQWKLKNLANLQTINQKKFQQQYDKLKTLKQ